MLASSCEGSRPNKEGHTRHIRFISDSLACSSLASAACLQLAGGSSSSSSSSSRPAAQHM
jgi:hypothetical protein